MSTDPTVTTDSALYGRVTERFTALVADIGASDWALPTPCEGWSVRDLLTHVVDRDHRIQASLGGPPYTELTGDVDLVQAWAQCTAWWSERLADPVARAVVWTTVLGSISFADAADRMMIGELTLHGWDLARALGSDETMDPQAVSVGFAGLRAALEALNRPAPDGPVVADDAPEAVRFLAFSGRQA